MNDKKSMDKNEAIKRSMRSNTSKDTSIEILLRRELFKRGVRYRKNVSNILGRPDIAIKKYKLLVFCDGDFWHGRKNLEVKTNIRFWDDKIKRNRERDLEYTIRLRDEGWIVLRFWESEIKKNVGNCADQIVSIINETKINETKRRKE